VSAYPVLKEGDPVAVVILLDANAFKIVTEKPPGIGQVCSILLVTKSITAMLPRPCGLPWVECEPRLAT
jgi:hypothetical protein